jgi:hypothetical protein
MTMTSSRRTFIKVGLAGAIILATAGGAYRAATGRTPLATFALDDEGRAALGAIARSVLHEAISPGADGTDMAVSRTLNAIAGLPLATQKEIQDLFGLLTLAPTRRFLAGVPVRWSDATQEDVAKFLESWRAHRFAMLQTAYHALHDLVIGGWYADESTWTAIGYPGPMKILS